MTQHIPKWTRVSSILGEMKHKAFVTSTEWGEIAKELETYELIDPSKPGVRPTPTNFKQMRIGSNLTLVNAGTEDQETVNYMNVIELGEDLTIFQMRRDALITGHKKPTELMTGDDAHAVEGKLPTVDPLESL